MRVFRALLTFIAISVALHCHVNAQDNALDFDGIDDYASAAGASALIANLPQFSMAFWIYPTNPAPSYPNFEGVPLNYRNLKQ